MTWWGLTGTAPLDYGHVSLSVMSADSRTPLVSNADASRLEVGSVLEKDGERIRVEAIVFSTAMSQLYVTRAVGAVAPFAHPEGQWRVVDVPTFLGVKA